MPKISVTVGRVLTLFLLASSPTVTASAPSSICEQHICCDPLGEQCSNGAKCECVSAKEEGQRRLLFGSIPKDDCFCAAPTPNKRKYNVLWMLIDDVSVERFPESGNTALEGLLPGFDELKADGAVFYDNLYAPSSICAPAQASIFSGMDPGRIGAHHQFAGDNIEGLREYKSTPPPEVEFMPEILRQAEFGSGLVQECGSVVWPLLSVLAYLLSVLAYTFCHTPSLSSSAGGLLVDWCRQAGLSSWRRECRLSFIVLCQSNTAIKQPTTLTQVIPTFCASARSNVLRPPWQCPRAQFLRLLRAHLMAMGRAQPAQHTPGGQQLPWPLELPTHVRRR
jgi:hypothetical protein